MQASLDELARMRDVVSNGALPSAARELIGAAPRTCAAAGCRRLGCGARTRTGVRRARPGRGASTHGVARSRGSARARGAARARTRGTARAAWLAAGRCPGCLPRLLCRWPQTRLSQRRYPVEPGVEQRARIAGPREAAPVERVEMARVDADLLDTMLNNAGEVSIFRSRLDQQVNSIDFNLAELARTVTRLKEQLRGLGNGDRGAGAEPASSTWSRGATISIRSNWTAIHRCSSSHVRLAETSSDVASIQGLLETLTREAQNLLTQQARVITELQNSLMRTRMVPFQRHVQRLTRLVRQAANDTGKRAELAVQGAAAELDRQMLERMVPPLEHMLRNSVVHGIESAGSTRCPWQARGRPNLHQFGARRRGNRHRGCG